ncbi:MAG: membrane protein insertase YidC [Mycoplasmataceae bacterium]|nr:membrane protein insertase YidC [Mycoplasmataceae bacterium]
MSTKSALNLGNQNLGPSVASPFWVRPASNKDKAKKVFKQIWKWTKILIFIFFMTMGLWGCFQTMWDGTITTNATIGGGLEFGFPLGQTGDWRYDLSGSMGSQYHVFSQWTMSYGPFYGLFVFPGAALVLNLMYAIRNWWGGLNALLAIFILLLIIRIISITITLRSTLQNERMTEVQGKIAEINAKYKDLKDMASKQKKQQETMELYKKYNIKPFAAFEQMFITLPIFLIVYRVVTICRPLKATNLFTIWNFGLTPLSTIFGSNFANTHPANGPMGWTYIFFLLIVIPAQFFSMILPQRWAKKRNRNAMAISAKGGGRQNKMKIFQYVFAGVMALIVAFSAVGVGVYWFLNSLFSIGQSYVLHKLILRNRQKGGHLEDRLKSLGI